ncbi:MAG TPA: hypothetical protein DCL60_11615, partial [Armatimonadetes bacterium]|nr:hypothetical protein [Armatimonadota bacterium]
ASICTPVPRSLKLGDHRTIPSAELCRPGTPMPMPQILPGSTPDASMASCIASIIWLMVAS